MSWEPLKQSLADFDCVVARLKVKLGNDAPVVPQINLTREFLRDQETLSEKDLLVKWNPQRFKAFYDAAIVTRRITEAVVTLQNQPEGALRKRLKPVLSGSLTQDFMPEQAKDFFYELEVASALKRAGFDITLREPDIAVRGNGLGRELGMACKYPSSEAQVHSHCSKGYRQLSNQNMAGFVVIGMDIIIFRAAFNALPHFVDFRQGNKHPLLVASSLLDDAMKALVVQRTQDYPSERPIDGAILTLSVWGICGTPAALTCLTTWAVQCDAANPILLDIERLVTAVQSLNQES